MIPNIELGIKTVKGQDLKLGDILSADGLIDTVVVIDEEGNLHTQVNSEPSMAFELEGFIIVEWKWPNFDIYGHILSGKICSTHPINNYNGIICLHLLEQKDEMRLSIKVNNLIYVRYID